VETATTSSIYLRKTEHRRWTRMHVKSQDCGSATLLPGSVWYLLVLSLNNDSSMAQHMPPNCFLLGCVVS
jgi:hypothetical protein